MTRTRNRTTARSGKGDLNVMQVRLIDGASSTALPTLLLTSDRYKDHKSVKIFNAVFVRDRVRDVPRPGPESKGSVDSALLNRALREAQKRSRLILLR